jgi:teichuronic acid biosynthesis glycosyltransferase TuaH
MRSAPHVAGVLSSDPPSGPHDAGYPPSGPQDAVLDASRTIEAPSGPADVVFCFSYLTWQAVSQQGGFHSEARFARTLISHERVRRLLVCNTMRSLPRKLVGERLARGRGAFPADERRGLLEPVRLRRREPVSIGGIERSMAAYDRALRRGAARMGLKDPVVITSHPLIAGFAELAWARAVTFYATDDWSAYPPARRWWPAYRESYARVRARGRGVGAVSPALLERLAPTGPSEVVPNGLEPAEWVGAAQPPAWVGELPQPLLLYAGTLDSRLDVPGLLALARARPDATILLVGPLVDPGHLEALCAVANIEIRPPLGRTELTGLVRSADVGLIPHVRSPLTSAMSPLKLYEYLGAGLPVVATDLDPVRGVSPRVVLVPEGGDLLAAVDTALALGHADEDERLAFIEANTWRARHDRLLDLALAG